MADRKAYLRQWSISRREQIYERVRKSKESNPDKYLSYTREYNKRNRDKINKYKRQWRKLNSDKVREQSIGTRRRCAQGIRNYYQKRKNDPEYIRKRLEWRQNNKARLMLYVHKRKALKLAASGSCNIEQLQARFEYYGNVCAYCMKNTSLTIDHVIPLVRGGSNWPANLRPACESCNKSKGTKLLSEWQGYNGRHI